MRYVHDSAVAVFRGGILAHALHSMSSLSQCSHSCVVSTNAGSSEVISERISPKSAMDCIGYGDFSIYLSAPVPRHFPHTPLRRLPHHVSNHRTKCLTLHATATPPSLEMWNAGSKICRPNVSIHLSPRAWDMGYGAERQYMFIRLSHPQI